MPVPFLSQAWGDGVVSVNVALNHQGVPTKQWNTLKGDQGDLVTIVTLVRVQTCT